MLPHSADLGLNLLDAGANQAAIWPEEITADAGPGMGWYRRAPTLDLW